MATIQEQINQLKIDKQNLVNNLIEKGVEATNDETFTTLVPKVNDIQSGGDISEYFNTTYSGTAPNEWIKQSLIKKVPDVIIDDSVTSLRSFCSYTNFAPKIICNSNVTNMSNMYSNNEATYIDLKGLNTSNTTSMYQMFNNCSKLTSLDLSNFDTSKVNDMSNMFYYCSSLTSIDVSNFDTSKVSDMGSMFYYCNKLTSLDLSNFDTSNVTRMVYTFGYCSSLTNLDIRNFDFTKVTGYSSMFSGVPDDCLIIVKDDTAKEWITSKFTTLTNVKTVAELEAA